VQSLVGRIICVRLCCVQTLIYSIEHCNSALVWTSPLRLSAWLMCTPTTPIARPDPLPDQTGGPVRVIRRAIPWCGSLGCNFVLLLLSDRVSFHATGSFGLRSRTSARLAGIAGPPSV
jgi:hypothetical protein